MWATLGSVWGYGVQSWSEGHCAGYWQTPALFSSGADMKVTDKPEESGMEVSRSKEGQQGKTRMVLMSMMAKTSTVKVTRPQ